MKGESVIDTTRKTESADTPAPVISRTGPRRSESVRLAVLNAADDLLVERGFTALTIEGIAQRAGVAKQTIYRWWKSKVDILLDTLVDDAREALAWQDGTGDAGEDLKTHLRSVADFFQEPSGQVLQALLGQAQLDKDTATALREGFLREQREHDKAGLRALLTRAGLSAPADEKTAGNLVDVLLGPLYYRALVAGQPSDKELIDATAELVLALAVEPTA